jgi:predicted phage terminase large subunit-like protein
MLTTNARVPPPTLDSTIDSSPRRPQDQRLWNPIWLPGVPEQLTIYATSDFATMEPAKGKKEPDFTEHAIWGLSYTNMIYALDWWSGQYETDKSIQAMIKLASIWRPQIWWNEGGIIDKSIKPAIMRAMRETNVYFHLEALPSIMSKGAKLTSFHARYEAGMVSFPIRRKWATRVIEQLVKFPGGRWDDAADACGLIGRGLDQMMTPHLPSDQEKPSLVPFSEAWLETKQFPDKPRVRYF